MAAVDPYSACPCGSGEKFKWCCQKVEAVADRAQRLVEAGQTAAAIEVLDEGLRKEPGNPWLLTRKALSEIHRNDPEAAKEPLRQIVRKQPKHPAAQVLLTRLVLETEGPVAGAAQLQRALAAFDRDNRKGLANLVRVAGAFLAEAGLFPAALKHLELVNQLDPESAAQRDSGSQLIESNPAISPWLKNPYRLVAPQDDLSDETQSRFDEALDWAGDGLWASAAEAFERLSGDRAAGPEANRNLGLCRLWLADNAGAVTALRRFVARAGETPDAVDIEALCQHIAPLEPDDEVEEVQWIWPLRDREGLLESLEGDPTFQQEEDRPIDPDDPESPTITPFGMLDHPPIQPRLGLSPREIPRFVGRLLVGQEIVALESYDDGRLDGLSERFTTLAGASIAPAHPKTKVLGKVPRSAVSLAWEWHLPMGMDRDEVVRLNREQGAWMVRELWPKAPMPYLKGRTPLEAAAAGNAEVPLRAAVFQLELTRESWRDEVDFGALRALVKIGSEPEIDPETFDLDRLHLARFSLVPVARLSDERLLGFWIRAKRTMQVEALERATLTLLERRSVMKEAGLEPLVLHSDMVVIEAGRGRIASAFDWLQRGRQADPLPARARNAPVWDMLEIRLKARTEAPEVWVPALAVVLDRHSSHPASNETVIMSLIDMGLLRMVPNPDRPEEVAVDPRPLQALLAEYGPRVTTASGQLGAAATRGEIWTPGSSPGEGAIWTPGSSAASASAPPAPGGDKPKLIIPGR